MPPRRAATTATTATLRAPQLLTLKEVGLRLGISHDSVERLVTAGALAVVDVSTGSRPRLRVSEAALGEFIAARTLGSGRRAAQ